MDIQYSFIIVDDSELDRYVTQKFLERTNNSVSITSINNAQDALEMIRERAGITSLLPTMILLDLQMPGMSGFKFVEEFEKFPAEVKNNYRIIILTILSPSRGPADVLRILTYSTVDGIIEKPLTKEKLLSLITGR